MLPPIVQYACVEGSGANTSPCSAAAVFSWSLMTPGWQPASRRSGSMKGISCRYLEQSITTATFTVSPERLVPQPLASSGAWWRRQVSCTATMSSTERGTTTPIGTCR